MRANEAVEHPAIPGRMQRIPGVAQIVQALRIGRFGIEPKWQHVAGRILVVGLVEHRVAVVQDPCRRIAVPAHT